MGTPGIGTKPVGGKEFFNVASVFDDNVRFISQRHLRTFEKKGDYSEEEIKEIAQSALAEYNLNKEEYKARSLDEVVNLLAFSVAHKQLEPTLQAIYKDIEEFANKDEQIKSMMDRCSLFRDGVKKRPDIISTNLMGFTEKIAEKFKPAIRTLIEPVLASDQSRGGLIQDSLYWFIYYIRG